MLKKSSGINWPRNQPLFPYSRRYVAIDVETVNSYKDIIEIGCVEIINNQIGRTMVQRLKPLTNKVNPFCVGVHGITLRDVIREPRFSDFKSTLVNFVGASPILAHNRPAEYKSLLFEFDQIGEKMPFDIGSFYCTMKMAHSLGLSGKLRGMSEKVGINVAHLAKEHDALSDTKLAAMLFLKLLEIKKRGSI